jgi:CHASE1-domain containing sensor protein
MSADHNALIRTAKQLIAAKIAIVHTLEARRRDLEKRIDDSGARVESTRGLLDSSAALLQQSKGHVTK